MLNVSLIRSQVLLVSQPGPLAEAAIRAVVAEAERYAKEDEPATPPVGIAVPGLAPGQAVYLDDVRADLNEVLNKVREGVKA